MRPLRVRRLLGALPAVVALGIGACSVEDPSSPEAPVLRGLFRSADATTTDHSAGTGVPAIEFFRDGRYRRTPRGCSAVECEENGRFSVDADRDVVQLIVDGSGRSYTATYGTSAAPSSDDATELAPRSLVPATRLIDGPSALIVTSVDLLDDEKKTLVCDDPTAAQQATYDAALKAARCAAGVEACAAWLRSPENSDPLALLDAVKVRLSCALPNPAWYAATSGVGPTAQIFISKDRYYSKLDDANQMLAILHELAHATGRMNKEHGPYHKTDPKNEDAWTNAFGNACLLSPPVVKKCGSWE